MSIAERPGGTEAPGTGANGMQGPLISFCALCGRKIEPQKTRRGKPKQFCSDACRAQAWRRQVLKVPETGDEESPGHHPRGLEDGP